jgi:hypothetical protein
VSGAYIYICSGGLLTDTASSGTPYFLTANHCVSKKGEASSLDAFFQFVTPCGGACFDPELSSVPRTHGATILESSRTSDYTLMQLAEPAPAGSFFLGWTSAPVAYANGTSLYRFSHPSGAPQAYSEHSVDTSKGECRSWPRGNWIYSHDTLGATEGGSSGSPVVNGIGQVVGQLSGACGTNVYDPCDSGSNATVDGAFANYFSAVSQWLDPGTACTDDDNDGFCVEDDCDDANPDINPNAAEVCDDQVDNDCDGLYDGDDPDCSGDCELGAPGDPCVDDAECCSNKCKGKPGAKTCR